MTCSQRGFISSIGILCAMAILAAGCASLDKAEVGGLGGAGVGALIGQAIGGNTAATLIGSGVGLGLGYIIGNEMDKSDAKKRKSVQHEEVRPLADTSWLVLSVTPKPKKHFRSMAVMFNPDGSVITTKTYADGYVEKDRETYRIVGSTLIINKPDYIINSRYRIEGDKMYLDTGDHSVVLQRTSS